MNSILFIYIFSLFVITSPNFIFKLPINNHLVVAIIHAIIFSCILYFTYDIVNRDVVESATVNNDYKPDDGTVHTMDGQTTIVVDSSDTESGANSVQIKKNTDNIDTLQEQKNQTFLDNAHDRFQLAKTFADDAKAYAHNAATYAIQAAAAKVEAAKVEAARLAEAAKVKAARLAEAAAKAQALAEAADEAARLAEAAAKEQALAEAAAAKVEADLITEAALVAEAEAQALEEAATEAARPAALAAANPPTITNGDFSQPSVASGSYKYYGQGTTKIKNITGWSVWNGSNGGGVILVNNSGSWVLPKPYPNGTTQCIVIQKTAGFKTANTNVFYPGVTYNLTFYACPRGRTYAPYNKANPIKVGFVNGATFITVAPTLPSGSASTCDTCWKWIKYSVNFTSNTTEPQQISFTGQETRNDLSTGIQGIEVRIVDGDTTATASTPYTRLGSYDDKDGPQQGRALPVNKGRSYTQKTCMDACPEYKYFAIQDGNQCFCGSSLSEAKKYGEKECGDNGGSYCNSLYQNNYFVDVTEPEGEEEAAVDVTPPADKDEQPFWGVVTAQVAGGGKMPGGSKMPGSGGSGRMPSW